MVISGWCITENYKEPRVSVTWLKVFCRTETIEEKTENNRALYSVSQTKWQNTPILPLEFYYHMSLTFVSGVYWPACLCFWTPCNPLRAYVHYDRCTAQHWHAKLIPAWPSGIISCNSNSAIWTASQQASTHLGVLLNNKSDTVHRKISPRVKHQY